MKENTDLIASKHLGKKSSGSEQYDKSLLVAIPRDENRRKYKIDSSDLPFTGWDIWHAYEFSVLTENNLPVTRLLKLKYCSDSEYIVESKSLKLYLNSFNMTKIGKNTKDTLTMCKSIIENDLSNVLKTDVKINFLDNTAKKVPVFAGYKNILDLVNEDNLVIEDFNESPHQLKTETTDSKKQYFYTFDSLRSNCRVTHQPDFGDVFIYCNSKKHIFEDSLIKYLVSFRKEYHFHEECVEMIYKRIFDLLDENDELFVCALYTRRGGIDICPARWSKNFSPGEVDKLTNLNQLTSYGVKQ